MSTASEEQAVAEEATPAADTVAEEPGTGESTAETPEAAQFDELQQNDAATTDGQADEVELDVILDVPVTLALEVGRTRMTIRDLLRLNQGSVVELDRPADEPMDVLVNGTLVAHAEIVVVDDMFGIRLIDVVSPTERIRNLR